MTTNRASPRYSAKYSALAFFGMGPKGQPEYRATVQAVAWFVGETLQPYTSAQARRLHVQFSALDGAKRSLRHKTLTPERLAALLPSTLAADDFFHLVFQDLAFADRTGVVGVYGSLTSFPNDPEIRVTLAVGHHLLPAGARALEPLARTLTQLVKAYYGCIEQEVGWMHTSVPPPTVYDPIWERYRTRSPAHMASTPIGYWGNLVPRAWLALPGVDAQLPPGILPALEDWGGDLVYVRFPQAALTNRRLRRELARSCFRFPSPPLTMQPPPTLDHDDAWWRPAT